jgi:hypothetical protein
MSLVALEEHIGATNGTPEGIGCPDEEDGRHFESPFLVFYEPDNLYRLAQQLGLQSGADLWEPSEQQVREIRPVMAILSHAMVKFIDWIDERVGGSY